MFGTQKSWKRLILRIFSLFNYFKQFHTLLDCVLKKILSYTPLNGRRSTKLFVIHEDILKTLKFLNTLIFFGRIKLGKYKDSISTGF